MTPSKKMEDFLEHCPMLIREKNPKLLVFPRRKTTEKKEKENQTFTFPLSNSKKSLCVGIVRNKSILICFSIAISSSDS